jgi:hypothetical protein
MLFLCRHECFLSVGSRSRFFAEKLTHMTPRMILTPQPNKALGFCGLPLTHIHSRSHHESVAFSAPPRPSPAASRASTADGDAYADAGSTAGPTTRSPIARPCTLCRARARVGSAGSREAGCAIESSAALSAEGPGNGAGDSTGDSSTPPSYPSSASSSARAQPRRRKTKRQREKR